MNNQERAEVLIERLGRMKGSYQWGHEKIHPWLYLQDRDLIITALKQYIRALIPNDRQQHSGFAAPTE